MNTIEQTALAKFCAKKVRDQVDPGEYDVDFIVRVLGSIKVGHDATVPANIPYKDLALLLLSKVNQATRESVLASYEAGDIEVDEKDPVIQSALQRVRGSKTTTRKGAVTSDLSFEATPYQLRKVG